MEPHEGQCETINWLAAEVLEQIEGTAWMAWRGRFGYLSADPNDLEGAITDKHVILIRSSYTEVSEFDVFADFSLQSSFSYYNRKPFPMAVRGLINTPTRGVKLTFERTDESYDHLHRIIDSNLGEWVRETTPAIIAQMNRRNA